MTRILSLCSRRDFLLALRPWSVVISHTPLIECYNTLVETLLPSGIKFLSDWSHHVIGWGDKFGVTDDSQRVNTIHRTIR